MEKMEKTEIHDAENKTDGLYAFFEKNRRGLLVSVVAILVFTAALIAVLLVNDTVRKGETAKLDVLIERYDKVKEVLSTEGADGEAGGTGDEADVETLLGELRALGESARAYPAARAWFMAADIYHRRGEWEEAEAAWLAAAEKGAKTHLAPFSLFNAAVAGEERGDTEAALMSYRKSLDFADFPAAAHAQFSVGRLEEKNGDNEAAIAAYRAVIDKWPSDTDWTNLAHSRILTLEVIEAR
ncbi:MAG: tetratricopeptide repeat protein [Spirochaetaceae bacterium]|jgi:tetratricopeptide (TPR) repeat protein|nr:tetratricopeptide repeat protein [Spirochaetaceae bacterium]